MMHNLQKLLVLLSLFAWAPAHAGFLDKLFGSTSESSPAVSSKNPIIYDTVIPLNAAANVSDYRLGAGDKLGITIGDLQALLTTRLKDGYLVDPKVYVTILEYRPFFVNGEVGKPGGYPYQPGLTIRKAISLAGGLTPRASLTKIYVIHESDPTGTPRLTTLNAVLQPGDTITIDQSFF